MAGVQDLVGDAEAIVNYALLNKITLPAGTQTTLLAASANPKALESPGTERDIFCSALESAVDTIGVSPVSLRSSELRRQRLAPLVRDAQSLLEFAASNAMKIDEDIRNPIVAVAASITHGAPSVADEQTFFKAYEALTMKTAPVTAETLAASRTVLPHWETLFSKTGFWKALQDATLGRFIDALGFVFVLLVTCGVLGYYSMGSTVLEQYRALDEEWDKVNTEQGKDKVVLTLLRAAEATEQGKGAGAATGALALARKNVLDAQRKVDEDQARIDRIFELADPLPNRLWQWSRLPCESWLLAWALCSSVDKESKAPASSSASAAPSTAPLGEKNPPVFTMKIEAARTVVARMTEIVLPLLLGWLGAHAFVLRQMTREISARSFAKASALHHLVRLSLGALAGFASTWFLTPEMVGGVQLKNIPSWALAFVAGYGIELVFAFMDRIIAAFATKTP